MVASVFGDIVVNAHWQHAFVILILPFTWHDDGSICYTSWSPLIRIEGTLNSVLTFLVCYDPLLYLLFKPCGNLRFSRIMHDRMLQVLYGPSLMRKMFPWPAHSPDLSLIEIVWSMVAE
ncbi:hypothetical protein TNCV_4090591 [Trichonephila clavipes]|uniref:Uncharacterized protein n=1 Tax=Trichonephila clavipes TaxID=2585209 RepID=A0A8X6SCV4_TRICX|nr:hypothetical protein TNCV_4090591 [Trichonephila clavipes]